VGSGNEIDLRPMKFRDDRARPSDQKVNYTIKEQLRDLFFVATPAPDQNPRGGAQNEAVFDEGASFRHLLGAV